MILQGLCKACNWPVRIDIGTLTKQEVVELLKKMESFKCPGQHAEMSSPFPEYWNVQAWELVEKRVSWVSAYPDHDVSQILKPNDTVVVNVLMPFRTKEREAKPLVACSGEAKRGLVGLRSDDRPTLLER
jgi:hypothetical protein